MRIAPMLDTRGEGPGPHPDVSSIPTPPLQRVGLFVIFVFPALSTLLVGLRFYARGTMHSVGLDDWLCGLALIAAILVSSSLYMFFKLNYYGWKGSDVPDFDPSPGLWWNFFEQLCYNPVLALVKVSVLVFLQRLGLNQNATTARIIWGLMTVVVLHAISVFFGALLQCIPIRANWHPDLKADPGTMCIDDSFHIIQSSLIIFTDVLILVLPFWVFLGVNINRAAKLTVLGVFAVGTLVPVVGIIRLVNLYKLLYLDEKAETYNIAYVWTVVEVNTALICCCIPALRPLASRWAPTLFSSGGGSRPSRGRPYGSYPNGASCGAKTQTGQGSSMGYMLQDLHPIRKQMRTEIRGESPTGSEEEIMTYNGIMRTTNFNIVYGDDDTKPSDSFGDGDLKLRSDSNSDASQSQRRPRSDC